MRRYVVAILVSASIVAIAPFVGQIRDLVRAAMSLDGFLVLMAVLFAAGLGAFLLFAAFRIREQRGWRYALVVLGLGLIGVQLFIWNRDVAEVNAVERIHFFYYGLAAFLFYRAFRFSHGNAWIFLLTLTTVFLVGTLDEWLQWLVPVRTGDVMDIFLNLYAGLCGLVLSLGIEPPSQLAWRGDGRTTIHLCSLLTVALLTFGGFVHCAHLGYGIHDPEIGWFRSYFTQDELLTHKERKPEEWEKNPPIKSPWVKEDYYWTEGGLHLSHRNASFARRDYYQAWQENRLLEKYFEPFMNIRYLDGTSPRLPSSQLQEVEEGRPQPDPYPYRSPVGQERIFLVPSKAQWWSGIAVLATLLQVPLLRRILATV